MENTQYILLFLDIMSNYIYSYLQKIIKDHSEVLPESLFLEFSRNWSVGKVVDYTEEWEKRHEEVLNADGPHEERYLPNDPCSTFLQRSWILD